MKHDRSSTTRPTLLITIVAALSGCGGQGPTIDDAVFVPDPALPAPKAVSPGSPPPTTDPAKAIDPPKTAPATP